jgi:hypothetical protein
LTEPLNDRAAVILLRGQVLVVQIAGVNSVSLPNSNMEDPMKETSPL